MNTSTKNMNIIHSGMGMVAYDGGEHRTLRKRSYTSDLHFMHQAYEYLAL